MKVVRIFRGKSVFFHSIERVFSQLDSSIDSNVSINNFVLPKNNANIFSLFINFISTSKIKYDVYHITGVVTYISLILPKRLTLLTIHDNVFLTQKSGFLKFLLKKLFLDWPVKRVTLVTTISEKSKNEIVQYSGCKPDKIVVIPNPVDQNIYFKYKEFNESNPQFLFIGSTPLKNLERVLEAMKGIKARLLLIGRFDEVKLSLIQQSGIDFCIKSNLTDLEMADAYAESDAVIFPSLYEGFGLPIIEGQKAGRPVITSNISPMKEVAGLGACLVDPYSVESIRKGMLRVIQDASYRNLLVEKGFENVKNYEPARISEKYNECYIKLYQKR